MKKTKYLLVATFSMGFIVIIPISNTGLAFAVVIDTSHAENIDGQVTVKP